MPTSIGLPPLAYLRASSNKEKAEAFDPLTGLVCRVDRAAGSIESLVPVLAKAIDKRREELGVGTDEVNDAKGWIAKGWDPSLDYYLASRRVIFADSRDQEGRVRDAVLREYVSSDGQPPRHQWMTATEPVALDDVEAPDVPLSSFLLDRRSVRGFTKGAVRKEDIGVALKRGLEGVRRQRQAANADNSNLALLHSFGSALVFGLVIYDGSEVPAGAYGYDVEAETLTLIQRGNLREEVVDILQGMPAPRTASFTFFVFVDIEAYSWRYRHDHALRRLYIEAGVIVQFVSIAARSVGLEGFVTPAQKDSKTLDLFGLQAGRFLPVHTTTCGTVARRRARRGRE